MPGMMLPRRSALATLALAGAGLLATRPARAGTLEVLVLGANGQPVPDAVVQLRRAAGIQPVMRAETAVIGQKDIRFDPFVTVVPLGGTVRFVNRDRFDHHVRSMPGGPLSTVPPVKEFEFRLGPARGGVEPSAEIRMDAPGHISIGCHLHSSMRGHILVTTSPWYAVTDASGKAVIDGPEGASELRLWHPEQLLEQPMQQVAVGSSRSSVEARLNFNPPRRRPARPPGGDPADPYRY
jgi:plastocyanin